MTDQQIRLALQERLDRLPLPERLLRPTEVVRQRQAHQRRHTRRRWWTIAAVAAALALVLPVVGPRLADAAQRLFMTVRFVEKDPDTPQRPPDQVLLDWHSRVRALKPGESLELPERPTPGGYSMKEVATAYTVKELQEGWPLPAYRAPAPQDTAVIRVEYNRDLPFQDMLEIRWTTRYRTQERNVWLQYRRHPEPLDESLLAWYNRKGHELPFLEHPSFDLKTETVAIKGQDATAFSLNGGKNWQILWESVNGSGSIGGDLPLKELVRIINSVPQL